jgi:hypothetical protein
MSKPGSFTAIAGVGSRLLDECPYASTHRLPVNGSQVCETP